MQVSSMEQEVAEKLALVQQLQQQQQALLHKQAALENSLGAQQALADQLEALRLSVAPPQAARQAVCADAAELEQVTAAVLLGRQGNAQHLGAAAAVKAGEVAPGQQQQQSEAFDVLRRYKQYVLEAAAALAAGDTTATAADSPAGTSTQQQQQQQQQQAADGFPAFPFNLIEALSLWKVSQTVGVPDLDADSAAGSSNTAAAAAAGGGDDVADVTSGSSSTGSTAVAGASAAAAAGNRSEDDIRSGTVNLTSFLHDVVPLTKWVQVAQQLSVQPWQRQQLQAAWQLYTASIEKLNLERQQLVQQLQEKLEDGSIITAGAAGIYTAAAQRGIAGIGLTGAAARIRQSSSSQGAGSSSSGVGCICSPLSGSDLLGYLDLANAVEWNLVRGRAMVMLFGWAMLCVLGRDQIGRLCVASWPHFPLMRAVAAVLVAGTDLQQGAPADGV
jgi:hypothetical protein